MAKMHLLFIHASYREKLRHHWLRVLRLSFRAAHREAPAAPPFIPFRKRTDSRDPLAAQKKRQPCRRHLIWARTKEYDFAIAGDDFMRLFQFGGVHVQGPWNRFRLRIEIEGVAQVHDDHVLAGIDFPLEFFWRDPGDFQLTQESSAVVIFPTDISRESGEDQDQQPFSQVCRASRDSFEFAAEHVAGDHERAGPKQSAERVEQQKPPPAHADDPRQRRRHGIQSWYEFRNEEDTRASFSESHLRPPHARIRLEGYAAEQLQHTNTFSASQFIPYGVARHTCDHRKRDRQPQIHPVGSRK